MPQGSGSDFSLGEVLALLRRRAQLIVLCFVLVTGAAFGLSRLQTKKYTATASLLFSNSQLAQELSGLPSSSFSNITQQSLQDTNVQLVEIGDMATKTASQLGAGLTKQSVKSAVLRRSPSAGKDIESTRRETWDWLRGRCGGTRLRSAPPSRGRPLRARAIRAELRHGSGTPLRSSDASPDECLAMNVAILGSRGFPSTYGGYETLVRYLARDWTQQGHAVTVYCRSRETRRRRWVSEGVCCRWTPGLDSNRWSTLSFGATSHVHASLQNYDAVLVLNVANGYFLPFLRARGIPCAVNTDGIEWERGKWGPAARRVFRGGAAMSARYADVLIADSQAIAAIWTAQFGAASRFIPYGAPVLTDVPTDRVEALGLVPSSYVLAVARLIPENNVDLLLDALALIPSRPPAVVVGSATSDSALVRRLRQLDRDATVKWLGHVADQELLTQLWANCGVYVHGHSVGGTNPALLQALGAGAPTIALDTVFNREVLGNDVQTFPPDAAALSRRIVDVLGSADLRAIFAPRDARSSPAAISGRLYVGPTSTP